MVSGPATSSDLNEPTFSPYVFSSPSWQNTFVGHSGGPPSTVAEPEHFSVNSDSVVTWFLSANALVTANAFWSAAWEGWPNVRLFLPPNSFSAVTVASRSLEALAGASGPLAFLLRNSVSVPTYSGTTWISPRSSCGS